MIANEAGRWAGSCTMMQAAAWMACSTMPARWKVWIIVALCIVINKNKHFVRHCRWILSVQACKSDRGKVYRYIKRLRQSLQVLAVQVNRRTLERIRCTPLVWGALSNCRTNGKKPTKQLESWTVIRTIMQMNDCTNNRGRKNNQSTLNLVEFTKIPVVLLIMNDLAYIYPNTQGGYIYPNTLE